MDDRTQRYAEVLQSDALGISLLEQRIADRLIAHPFVLECDA